MKNNDRQIVKALFIVFILQFIYTTAWAITPEEVLIRFKTKLIELKNYMVETEEKGKTIGPQGMEENIGHGKTYVKNKKRYTETTIIRNKILGHKSKSKNLQKEENHIVQIFDGTTSWLYEKEKKIIRKVDFTRLPPKIQEKIMASQDVTDLKLPEGLEFELEEKKEDKKKFYVLTSKNTVTTGSQKYDKIILWIDAQQYLPVRMEMHGKIIVTIPQAPNLEIRTQVVQEFNNWELNPDIPDSRFVFTVPEGVKVKDVTEETGGIYERYMKDR